MKLKIGFLFLLSLIFFGYSQSAQLTGRISSYFNSYQIQDLYTQEKTSYLRAYQSFIFDLNQIGINTLSIHTYFRSTTDFALTPTTS